MDNNNLKDEMKEKEDNLGIELAKQNLEADMEDLDDLEEDKPEEAVASVGDVRTIHHVEKDEVSTRLDIFLTKYHPELTRTHVQKLISEGNVKAGGNLVKANYKVKFGEDIEIVIPAPRELSVEAENIPLEILYEDKDVVVVNKPQGMVVHPASGIYSGTLVNALLYHCKDLSGINGVMRPGIVHRIDKDTSGVLVVAKNDQAHLSLAKQIKDKTINRIYKALVHNNIAEPAGVIHAPIGRDPKDRKKMAVVTVNSKDAVTRYKVIDRYREYTYIQCKLETGRTHQIRVHMAYLGNPVVGDPKYGPRKIHFGLKGQALHAETLGFEHPSSGKYMEFSAPLPNWFAEILEKLNDKRILDDNN